MDILKRALSPIPDEAWEEIDDQARSVLKGHLSARRFVDVSGPHGWEYAARPIGRIRVDEDRKKDDVGFGVHEIMPLVETRCTFTLDRWELDNAVRGAKDIDFGNLDEAARSMARFEEEAVYHGLDEGCIVGMKQVGSSRSIDMDTARNSGILRALAEAVNTMRDDGVEGPYALVAGKDLWNTIYSVETGYPMTKRIDSITDGGDIIYLPHFNESYLVSTRGDDLELTIGQDLSVGYVAATEKDVQLFLTESFTFRVITPEAVIPFNVS
ncbi:MAG: bacteriocin family protein [Synergistales bacterium]|nr:bacteriocin family protein [Synergistales bacterium]